MRGLFIALVAGAAFLLGVRVGIALARRGLAGGPRPRRASGDPPPPA